MFGKGSDIPLCEGDTLFCTFHIPGYHAGILGNPQKKIQMVGDGKLMYESKRK